jgi:hypothetical protein
MKTNSTASELLKRAASTSKKKSEEREYVFGYEFLVDSVITLKKKLSDIEAKYKLEETRLLSEAGKLYEDQGKRGDYKTNILFAGNQTEGAMVVFSDKFSAIPQEKEKFLRDLDPDYDRHFTEKRVLSLKDTGDAVIEELVSLLGEEKFLKYFEVKISIVAKNGLAKEQFHLPAELREELKQAKPAVRLVTEDGKAV